MKHCTLDVTGVTIKRTNARQLIAVITFILLGATLASPASATFFDALQEPVFYNGVAGSNDFTSLTGFFTAESTPSSFDVNGTTELITDGNFSLFAEINSAGTLLLGDFDVRGTIPSLGFNSGTLLSGDLTGVMCDPVHGGECDFLFDTTGGDAAVLFPATGGGVLLTKTGFTSWDSGDFNSDSTVAEIGVPVTTVPVPAAVWLFGSGLLGLIGMARRKQSV